MKKSAKTPKHTPKQKQEIIKKFGHIPTKEELFAKIRESNQKMITALEGAWNCAPKEPAVRKQLTDAVAKASQLTKKLNELLKKATPTK